MATVRKIALAVIRDGKLLMARTHTNAEAFYNLGGKVKPGETELECLKREVMEEANARIDEASLLFLQEFEDVAFNKPDVMVNIRVYKGKLLDEPVPSGEIVEFKYFDSTIDAKHLTPLSTKIFAWLKEQKYIT